MRLNIIILLIALILPEVGLAATQEPKLHLAPSVLDRADEFFSAAQEMAESVDLNQLPSLSPALRQEMEFSMASIIQHAQHGRTLAGTLRELRSLSGAFLLSQLVDNLEDLGGTLATQLFEAAKQAGEHKMEEPGAVVDQAKVAIKQLEEGNAARAWATDAIRAYAPFKEVPKDLAVAVLEAARAADIALDDCLEE